MPSPPFLDHSAEGGFDGVAEGGVAFLEADAVVFIEEGLVEGDEGAVGLLDEAEGDRAVQSDGVNGAAFEHGLGRHIVFDLLVFLEVELLVFLLEFLQGVFEGGGAGGAVLRGDDFAVQIVELLEAGILLDENVLLVLHIGGRPRVLFLAFIRDGEAVPDAVDGSGVEFGVLRGPVDRFRDERPAVALADFLGEIKIEAFVFAVFTEETVGREFRVKTDGERLGGRIFRFLATDEHHGAHHGKCQQFNSFLHGFVTPFLLIDALSLMVLKKLIRVIYFQNSQLQLFSPKNDRRGALESAPPVYCGRSGERTSVRCSIRISGEGRSCAAVRRPSGCSRSSCRR